MALSLPFQPLSDVLIGNDAGWALSFHKENAGTVVESPTDLVRTRDDYYAEIEATLPGDLSAGVYKFTIEGFTDDDHSAVVRSPGNPTVVRLYLYWRDTNSTVGGYLASAAGITDLFGPNLAALRSARVAELTITKVSRRLGERRYETVIEARERVFDHLSKRITDDPAIATGLRQAVLQVGTWTKVSIIPYLDDVAHADVAAKLDEIEIPLPTQKTYAKELQYWATQFESATGKTGRGMLLVRDGILHWGLRPIPLEGGDAKTLSLASGLIETEAMEPLVTDPNAARDEGDALPSRRQFRLTLKGRPDLMPGDVVAFVAPPEEGGPLSATLGAALLGSLSVENPDTLGYVSSVQHRLGRTSGFSTVVTVVEVKSTEDGWDTPTPAGSRSAGEDGGNRTASADAREQAARAIIAAARGQVEAVETTEVGEVREMTTDGADEPPGQTLRVVRGLSPPDGLPHQARRLPLDPEKRPAMTGVAYTTPFAWGKYGLVLPRYPGTRVALIHRNGRATDAIEVGALWESGKGPTSEPGDWWLTLPADVDPGERKTADDKADVTPHEGAASNDLIDADGNRVIEVAGLTIRIGQDALRDAGERPEKAAEETLTIAVGKDDDPATSIVLKNGEIHLKADKIVLEAQGVTAELTNAMDVK